MCEKTENVLSCETVMLLRETNKERRGSPVCLPCVPLTLRLLSVTLPTNSRGIYDCCRERLSHPLAQGHTIQVARSWSPAPEKLGTRGPVGPFGPHMCKGGSGDKSRRGGGTQWGWKGNGPHAGQERMEAAGGRVEGSSYLYIYLAMWDLSSLTRDRTHAHCIDSSEC